MIATLARSLEHVSVACVLLGSAGGSPEQLAALHGTRLEMLLTRMVDTTVRGIVYEAAARSERQSLRRAPHACVRAARARGSRTRCSTPIPADVDAWTAAAVAAVNSALDGGPDGPR